MKNNHPEKLYIISLVLILTLIASFYLDVKTGNQIAHENSINVDIRTKIEGTILNILLTNATLEFGFTQNISTEFINTGSIPMTEAKIELEVYIVENGELNLSARYFDATVPLNTGARRFFKTVYVPPEEGIYFVRSKVTFDNRIAELWKVFIVFDPNAPPPIITPTITPNVTTTFNGTPTPENGTETGTGSGAGSGTGGAGGTGGGGGTTTVIGGGTNTITIPPDLRIRNMVISYPEEVDIYQNQSLVISIFINNTGEAKLNNLRLFVSTTNFVTININPKIVISIEPNEDTLFLISVNTTSPPPGKYPLDFAVITDEITIKRSSVLNVLPIAEPIENLRLKILNFKFLIGEIENDIFVEESRGYNVTLAKQSLEFAKSALNSAEKALEKFDFDRTREKLDETKNNIEKALFRLANVRIVLPAAPFPAVFILLSIIIIVVIAYFITTEKEMKRPRLLREANEE